MTLCRLIKRQTVSWPGYTGPSARPYRECPGCHLAIDDTTASVEMNASGTPFSHKACVICA